MFIRKAFHAYLLVSVVVGISGFGCKDGSKQADGGGNAGASTTPTPASSSNQVTDGSALYTGFDGKTDFSILLPGFRSYTVDDPSMAKIEALQVTLSEATITELVTEAKASNPNLDETRFKSQFSRQRTTFRIKPLKAGTVILRSARPGGGGPRNDVWAQGKGGTTSLIIADYSAGNMVDTGKSRYTTSGAGNLKACASCHETGNEGAPPHELGRVMEISDVNLLTWIKSGKTQGRVAKIQHTWEFSSADQEQGILAYLRSKQTKDVETLTKLYVEEAIANGVGMGPGPGGPAGGLH